MLDSQNFTAAVEGKEGFNLVVSHNGDATVITRIGATPMSMVLRVLLTLLGWFLLLSLAGQLVFTFFDMVTGSRTILVKLLFSSVPLLMTALAFFGIFSYRTYSVSVNQSFQKQVIDEGSLLRALFGTESFTEIEYPYQYTGESYTYLRQNMNTRSVYTSTAYYERQKLFVGVDKDYPCAYPFNIRLDAQA
ncbi:MAG: hypothetical protein RR209_03870, partial [Angelakisella sp.]